MKDDRLTSTLSLLLQIPHEQGAVVSCLSSKYNVLAPGCRKEIFRLAEMQSDDYHLDRALYYACRDDRDRLCAKVPSGNGRVYRCLYEQKFNTMMSLNVSRDIHNEQPVMPIVLVSKGSSPKAITGRRQRESRRSVDSR